MKKISNNDWQNDYYGDKGKQENPYIYSSSLAVNVSNKIV